MLSAVTANIDPINTNNISSQSEIINLYGDNILIGNEDSSVYISGVLHYLLSQWTLKV